MKTLSNYISEKLIINQQVNEKLVINKDYKFNDKYFIYKVDEKDGLCVFNNGWPEFNDYRNKVYVNNKKVNIGIFGWTIEKFEPGIYEVEIKDIDKVTYCRYMFATCKQLIRVPLFDTSNIDDMNSMFWGCKNLKEVELLNTQSVKNMDDMFKNCHNLSDETKQKWSTVYNFNNNTKK